MQVVFGLEELVPTVRLLMALQGSELETCEGPLHYRSLFHSSETLHPQQTRPLIIRNHHQVPEDQRPCENSDFIRLWSLLGMSGLSTLTQDLLPEGSVSVPSPVIFLLFFFQDKSSVDMYTGRVIPQIRQPMLCLLLHPCFPDTKIQWSGQYE